MNRLELAARNARSQMIADLTAPGRADIVTVMNTVDRRLVEGLAALEAARRAKLVALYLGVIGSEAFERMEAAELALLVTARASGPGREATVRLVAGSKKMYVTGTIIGGRSGVDMARGDGDFGFPIEILDPAPRLAVRPSAANLTPAERPPTVPGLLMAAYERKAVPLEDLCATTGLAALLRHGVDEDARRIAGVSEIAGRQLKALALLGGDVVDYDGTTARVARVRGLGDDPRALVLVREDGSGRYHRPLATSAR
jgi:hypothetical protein